MSSVLLALERDIKNYSLDLWILLGGIDTTGHLIQITNPGTWRSYDNLGFCCIGTGERHADSRIAYLRYSVNFPENEALYIVFEAKKRAEAAGGVGPTTDIWVINKEGSMKLPKKPLQPSRKSIETEKLRSEESALIDGLQSLEFLEEKWKLRELEIRRMKYEGFSPPLQLEG